MHGSSHADEQRSNVRCIDAYLVKGISVVQLHLAGGAIVAATRASFSRMCRLNSGAAWISTAVASHASDNTVAPQRCIEASHPYQSSPAGCF